MNISISDDSRLESAETFTVSLALPSVDQIGLQIGEPGMAVVTITDDDSKPQDPKHIFPFIHLAFCPHG